MKRNIVTMLWLLLMCLLCGTCAAESGEGTLEIVGPVYNLEESVATLNGQRQLIRIAMDSAYWEKVNLPDDGEIGGLYAAATDGENDWLAYTKEQEGKSCLFLSAVTKKNDLLFTVPVEEWDRLFHSGLAMQATENGMVLAIQYTENAERADHHLLFVNMDGEIQKDVRLNMPNSTLVLKNDGETENIHVFVDQIGSPTIVHLTYDAQGREVGRETAEHLYAFSIYEYMNGTWHVWDSENQCLIPLMFEK